MKNNLENSIKESLQNFEAPYNSAAWSAMNTKLDAKMPTSSTGGPLKWIAAASVVVVGLFATYYALNNDGNEEADVKMAEKSFQQTNTASEAKNKNSVNSNDPIQEKNSTSTPVDVLSETTNDEEIVIDNVLTEDIITATTNSIDVIADQAGPIGNGIEIDRTPSVSTPDIILPVLENICANEFVTIKNTNDIALELVGPSFNKMIAANSTVTVELKNAGAYQLFAENSSKQTDFDVKTLPDVDFIIDKENKFDNGLPIVKLTSTIGNNLTWTINENTYSGKEIDVHMYNRGAYNITLTEIGVNGCSNSVRKQLFNEEKYNLMAVEGFRPNDIDIRNNTFMPFALTQRDVKFTMIIIDPTDGHVVYQTRDSSQGWDGTDSKTGQIVKYGRAYVWKVVLENPERGENNEYAGNIIPITQ